MYGRTNAGGGISPFAFIFVTYPAGSVCTCTNGSRTLRLKDTSGYGVFYPPYIGTWTVTATDGEDTTSQTVEITTEWQSESVELRYGLYLYKNGNEYTEVTGGWRARKLQGSTAASVDKAPTLTKKATSLLCQWAGSSAGGIIEPVNGIDLREHIHLCFNVTLIDTRNSSLAPRIGVMKKNTTYWWSNASAITTIPTEPGVVKLDISALSTDVTEWEVFVGGQSSTGSGTLAVEFDSVWLE